MNDEYRNTFHNTSQEDNQGLTPQHSACQNCRAKKLKCSGQRPYCCKRCAMKKISCRYPPPESRKHKGQTEQTTASRQAASVARSRKVNDKIPHELQGVFSVTLPDVVSSSRPLPAVEQLPSPNTIGSSSRIDEPSLDSGYLFSIDESEFSIPSPMDNSGSSSSLSWDSTRPNAMSPLGSEFDLMEGFESTALTHTTITAKTANPKSPDRLTVSTKEPTVRSVPSPFDLTTEKVIHPTPSQKQPQQQQQQQKQQQQQQQHCSPNFSIIHPTNLPCHCFEAASTLLERWETNKYGSLDSLLKFQKATVYQLGSFLSCQRCSTLSAFMMLPLLMCEKIIASAQSNGGHLHRQGPGKQHELGAQEDIGGPRTAVEESHTANNKSPTDPSNQRQRQHPSPQPPSTSEPQPPTPKPIRLSFGEYNIESDQEWQSVSEVLVLNQLKELGGLLARYKGIAVSLGWKTQLALIVDLERRLRGMVMERRGRLVGLGE